MNYLMYPAVLVSGAVVALFLMYSVLRWQRNAPGAWVMVAMLAASAVWSLAYMLELTSAELAQKVFWAKVQYIGIAPIAPIWFIFAYYSVRRKCPLLHRARQLGLLLIIPAITLSLVWSNELHGWVWRTTWLDTSGPVPALIVTYGWWFWLHSLFAYSLLVGGAGWVLLNQRGALRLYRRQTFILLIGLLPVVVANIRYLTGWTSFSSLDPTPLAFLLTSGIYALGIFRYHMLSIVPLVHQHVVNGLGDPVIAIDLEDRIIHYNPAALQLTDTPLASLLGRPIASILGKHSALLTREPETESEPVEIQWGDADAQQVYSVQISPLFHNDRQLLGRLIVLHDISAFKRAEAALRESEWLYRSAIEGTGGVPYYIDYASKSYHFIGTGIEEVTGYSAGEITPALLEDLQQENILLGEMAGKTRQEAVAQAQAGKLPVWRMDSRIRTQQGEFHWMSDTAVQVMDSRGRVTGAIGVLQDITERKQIEEELRLLNQTLEERVAERTQALQNEIAERKKIEMELRAQEGKLRYQAGLLDIISDAVISTTLDFRILTWNRAAEQIYGYAAEEVMGQPLPNYVDTKYIHESAEEVLQQFMAHGFWQGEVTQKHKDGHSIHVWAAVKSIDDKEGQRTGIVAINRDMSAYKQAEHELRESEARYRSLVENTHDLIQSVDARGHFLFVNRSWFELLGYSKSELPHITLWQIIAPEEQEHCRTLFAQLKVDTKLLSLRTTFLTKQGDRIIVEGTATAKYEDDRFAGTYTFLRDVTARVEAEKALLQAEERYRGLFEYAPVMYVITRNDDGLPIILNCNQLFADTLCYPRDKLIGRSLLEFYTPDSKHKLLSGGYERAMADTFHAEERQLVTRAGGVVNTQLHTKPEFDSTGAVVGTRAMFVDISLRKQVEDRLRETGMQLRKLAQHIEAVREEERTRVAREVHDDLGQMLTALHMDVGWLDRHVPAADAAIQQKLDSMADLIATVIKSVQRIAAELRPGMLDTLGLVAAVQWQLEQFGERAEIDCKLEADFEDDRSLDRDLATVLFRILQEALTNVARHAQASELRVELSKEAEHIRMTVADNGVGLDPAVLSDPHSFGLIGMRERVHPWHGRLEIHSAPNQGTTIDIAIPFHHQAEESST